MSEASAVIRCAFPESDVKGLILKPGVFRPHVNGVPVDVRFSREAIMAAFDKLRARLAAGERLPIHLDHPELGGLPIVWGHFTGARANAVRGEVWLTESMEAPEMMRILTPEARERIRTMGLSVDAHMQWRTGEDGVLEASSIDVEGVSIVSKGAFDGSWITPNVPADLAAKYHFTPPAGAIAEQEDGNTMTKPKDPAGDPDAPGPAVNEQEVASLRAKAAEAEALLSRVKELEGQLRAKEASEGDLKAAVARLDGEVTKLTHANLAAEAERDVDAACASGKVTPAMRAAELRARSALGRDGYAELLKERPVLVPPGERGGASQSPVPQSEKAAADAIQTYGVDGVLTAGLHKLSTPFGDAVRASLAAHHAEHPGVRRELAGHMRAMKAKAGEA